MIRRRTKAKRGLRVWIYVVLLLAIVAIVAWKGLPKHSVAEVETNDNDAIILVE
jgi:lipopolysaccharide export system protein LptC